MLKHITEVGNMAKLPDWVLQHKKKGIAIETRNGRYYASRVTSVWDPKKGRAKKSTLRVRFEPYGSLTCK